MLTCEFSLQYFEDLVYRDTDNTLPPYLQVMLVLEEVNKLEHSIITKKLPVQILLVAFSCRMCCSRV
jgi:hypothetical protein